ncbi:MAG: VanZ family protein [Bacteroidales bacterium]|nr:VanZ family protein [Bacteroidales bacterium]
MTTNCIKTYPLSLLTTLAIIILSVMPFPEIKMAQDIPLADKWVHFVMYGGLSLVVWFEMVRSENKSGIKKAAMQLLLWGLVMPALLGGVLEFVQEYLTTTRSGDVWDFIADAIGAVLGTILGLGVRMMVKKRK